MEIGKNVIAEDGQVAKCISRTFEGDIACSISWHQSKLLSISEDRVVRNVAWLSTSRLVLSASFQTKSRQVKTDEDERLFLVNIIGNSGLQEVNLSEAKGLKALWTSLLGKTTQPSTQTPAAALTFQSSGLASNAAVIVGLNVTALPDSVPCRGLGSDCSFLLHSLTAAGMLRLTVVVLDQGKVEGTQRCRNQVLWEVNLTDIVSAAKSPSLFAHLQPYEMKLGRLAASFRLGINRLLSGESSSYLPLPGNELLLYPSSLPRAHSSRAKGAVRRERD